jgi:integrase
MPFKQVRKSTVRELRDKVRDKVRAAAVEKNGGADLRAGAQAANKVVNYLSAVLGWVFKEYDEDELGDWEPPRLHILKAPEVERERVLTDDEIRAIWPALDKLEDEVDEREVSDKRVRQRHTFNNFVKLLLLTGQRRSEIAALRWSEIDFQTATVRLPARQWKTRGKTGPSHEFALSKNALTILESIERRPGDDRVFVTVQYDRDKKRLDELAPTAEPWTLHDLRRTFAAIAFTKGMSRDSIDRQQGNVIREKVRIYARGAFAGQKRRVADTVASAIHRVVRPEKRGNVIGLQTGHANAKQAASAGRW